MYPITSGSRHMQANVLYYMKVINQANLIIHMFEKRCCNLFCTFAVLKKFVCKGRMQNAFDFTTLITFTYIVFVLIMIISQRVCVGLISGFRRIEVSFYLTETFFYFLLHFSYLKCLCYMCIVYICIIKKYNVIIFFILFVFNAFS